MSVKDCRKIEKELTSFVLEELDLKTKQLVYEHITECVACRKKVEQIKNTIAKLKALPSIAPSSERREATISAMLSASKPSRPTVLTYLRWGFIPVAVAVLLTISVMLFPAGKEPFCYVKLIEMKGEVYAGQEAGWMKVKDQDIIKEQQEVEVKNDALAHFEVRLSKDNRKLFSLYADQNTTFQVRGNQRRDEIYLHLIKGRIFIQMPAPVNQQVVVMIPGEARFHTTFCSFEASVGFIYSSEPIEIPVKSDRDYRISFLNKPLEEVINNLKEVIKEDIEFASEQIKHEIVSFYTDAEDSQEIFKQLGESLFKQGFAIVPSEAGRYHIIRSMIAQSWRHTLLVSVLEGKGVLSGPRGQVDVREQEQAFINKDGFPETSSLSDKDNIARWRFSQKLHPYEMQLLEHKERNMKIMRILSSIQIPSQPETVVWIKQNGELIPVKIKMK